jgi:hypothetical protein
MERCEKCSKVLGEYFVTAYGEKRCEDCWDDYLMTDRGKVEYFIGICKEDYPMSDFDADFLGYISVCWTKYRDELDLKMSELRDIEDKARQLGIL